MKAGEIWIVNIPELGTHEQGGTRPAVVVAKVAKTITTIIPCTTNQTALRFPFTHIITATKQNGLATDSIALTFHLRAIDTSLLMKKIGTLDTKTMQAIRAQARKLIG